MTLEWFQIEFLFLADFYWIVAIYDHLRLLLRVKAEHE